MSATLSSRHAAILDAIRGIPAGRVASYGQIAAIAGCAGRARLVGWTLRHAPDDAKLPWFRVLRADGGIAFAQGSTGFVEQSRRLAREKVVVVSGRVDLARFGWRRTLDELLWAPPAVSATKRTAATPSRAPRTAKPAPKSKSTPTTRAATSARRKREDTRA